MKDEVFAKPFTEISQFAFDKNVSNAFDDMVNRSVPFYEEVQRITAELCFQYYKKDKIIYDLGSSTGRTAAELLKKFQEKRFQYVGIDSSESMINKSLQKKIPKGCSSQIQFINENIIDYSYSNACTIIANYTLQFIRPQERIELLTNIYQSLSQGAVFILSEKVLDNYSENSQLFQEMYYNMKRRNGYSELEISQKREALENILIPYRLDEYKSLLSECGFEKISVVFKWYNFATIIAHKA